MACHRTESRPITCDTCHLERGQRERVRTGPWQATHGPSWRKTHGMGSLRFCATCHPPDYCVQCHGTALPHDESFGSTHGATAKRDLAACKKCHDYETVCTPCHGVPMPHEKGYLKIHSSKTSSVNDPKCTKCHRVDDCVFCHVRHVHTGNARLPAGGGR